MVGATGKLWLRTLQRWRGDSIRAWMYIVLIYRSLLEREISKVEYFGKETSPLHSSGTLVFWEQWQPPTPGLPATHTWATLVIFFSKIQVSSAHTWVTLEYIFKILSTRLSSHRIYPSRYYLLWRRTIWPDQYLTVFRKGEIRGKNVKRPLFEVLLSPPHTQVTLDAAKVF